MKVKKILLELDGLRYLINGREWSSLPSDTWQTTVDTLSKSLDVVSDFGVNPDLRRVYGDGKYSKFLLQKELRDSGEAVGNAELVVHKASKIDKLNTQLFYSLVSHDEYARAQRQVDKLGSQSLLFSFYSCYLRAVKHFSTDEPMAFIFVLPDSIDIVIASKRMIESYQSLPSFSSEQQGEALSEVTLNALADRITSQERIAKLKLSSLCVFEFFSQGDVEWHQTLARKTGLSLRAVPSTPITVDGEPRLSSLAPILSNLPATDALSSLQKRTEYTSRKWLPAVACLLATLCGGLYWLNDDLQQQRLRQHENLSVLQQRLQIEQPMKPVEQVNYQSYLTGVESILQAGIHTSYFEFISKISRSSAIGNKVIYDLLELHYPETQDSSQVQVNLIGHIDSGWNTPLNAFDLLTSNLVSEGFVVKESVIETAETGLSFAYRLEVPASNKGDTHVSAR